MVEIHRSGLGTGKVGGHARDTRDCVRDSKDGKTW